MRTSWARPKASLRSVLLIWQASAALAWRASRHTTGSPSCLSSCQRQACERPRLEPDLHYLRGLCTDERRDRRGLTRDLRFDSTAPS